MTGPDLEEPDVGACRVEGVCLPPRLAPRDSARLRHGPIVLSNLGRACVVGMLSSYYCRDRDDEQRQGGQVDTSANNLSSAAFITSLNWYSN